MCKVVLMPDWAAESGFGSVKRVMLTKLAGIPSWVPFAKKALRIEKEKEKRQLVINEARSCSVNNS